MEFSHPASLATVDICLNNIQSSKLQLWALDGHRATLSSARGNQKAEQLDKISSFFFCPALWPLFWRQLITSLMSACEKTPSSMASRPLHQYFRLNLQASQALGGGGCPGWLLEPPPRYGSNHWVLSSTIAIFIAHYLVFQSSKQPSCGRLQSSTLFFTCGKWKEMG